MRKREATKAHFQERMRSAPPRIENSARGLRSKMQWAKRIQLRIDDRDRIHDAFRIQRGLASPHRGDECRITVLRQLQGVRPADAVFRRERTVAFAHQSEDGLPYLSPAGWRKHVVMQVPVADIVSAKVKFASFALSRLVRFRRFRGFQSWPARFSMGWFQRRLPKTSEAKAIACFTADSLDPKTGEARKDKTGACPRQVTLQNGVLETE